MEIFANNAVSAVATTILSNAGAVVLTTGDGAKFPSPSGGDFFRAALFEISGSGEINHEIVKVTARSTDTLTITRAQEGTTARMWVAGSRVELRMTAAQATDFLSKAYGGALSNANISGVKTLTYNGVVDNSTSGSTKTIDFTTGLRQKVTMSANCTFTFTPPAGPAVCQLEIIQDPTTPRVMTLPTGKWDDSRSTTDKVLLQVVNTVHKLMADWNGTYWYYTLAKGLA